MIALERPENAEPEEPRALAADHRRLQALVRLCCAQHKRIYVAPEVMLRSSVECGNHAAVWRC
jgi:hypothetical protein